MFLFDFFGFCELSGHFSSCSQRMIPIPIDCCFSLWNKALWGFSWSRKIRRKNFFSKNWNFFKKTLAFFSRSCYYIRVAGEQHKTQSLKDIEAWLSLVERCVRDAEVASSNLVASIPACWSSGQDDALSRRKPGFDSRTGHEAVWNSIQLLFLCLS